MKKYLTYILALFIGLSVLLCLWGAIRFVDGKKWRSVEKSYQVQLMHLEQEKEAIWTACVEYNDGAVQDEMINLSLFTELDEYGPDVCMFLSPNVCGACVKDQSTCLLKYLSMFNQVAIVCPVFMKREYQALFSGSEKLRIFSYDYEKLANHSLQRLDDILLFRILDHKVSHVVLSVKENPEWTEKYYLYILSNLTD